MIGIKSTTNVPLSGNIFILFGAAGKVCDKGLLKARNTVGSSGLPKLRFFDLRHTQASLMLSRGIHPKIISERLGHSSINVTLDKYSHVLPGL